MVEINNQRKAFPICWRGRRELITDVRTKSWLWRHCRRRAIYRLLRSPSQTCHAKPKTQINRRRTLPASFPLVGCLPQAAWPGKTSLRKSGRCGIAAQIKERGAFTYDWSWWYPSGNRLPGNIWASPPGAGYGQFEHKADSLIANSKKRAERSERLMYEQSHRDYLRLWLSASSCLPVMGC